MHCSEICILLLLCYSGCIDSVPDPCLPTEYREIDEPRRSPAYSLQPTEVPLCDILLPNAWYRFVSEAGGMMPETCTEIDQCGTRMPLWLNGSHPRVIDGTVTRAVCVNTPNSAGRESCCEYIAYILVKNCNDQFFVYRLQPTPSCPMAYCAGNRRPCPPGQIGFDGNCTKIYPEQRTFPEIQGPEIKGGNFYFSCIIKADLHNDINFEVKWTADNEDIVGLPSSDTKLAISKLDGVNLRGHLNKQIGCAVRSFFDATPNVRSPWLKSNNTYWAGVRVEPVRIQTDETVKAETIYIVSTIPKVCSPETDENTCIIRIGLSTKGGLSVQNQCSYILGPEDWNDTNHEARITIKLTVKKSHMLLNDRIVVVEFIPIIDYLLNGQEGVFHNLSLTPVQVEIRDYAGRNCSSSGDPHIRGMEYTRSTYYNLYEAGVYTLYENTFRYFEIQTRTIYCNNVSCNCAVAIREYNDLIIIDSCDNFLYNQQSAPTVRIPRQSLHAATKIMRSADLKDTVVYLPSSTEVKVTMTVSMDVVINIPSTDRSYGKGICGTFDGVNNNEFQTRGFTTDYSCEHDDEIHAMGCVPREFTQSWKIDNAHNLFVTLPPEVTDDRPTSHCTCIQDNTISCSSREDIADDSMPCDGNCTEIKNFGFELNPSRKRANGFVDEDETISTYDPDLLADFTPRMDFSWPTPSGITEQKAEEMCRNAFMSSQIWSLCEAQNLTKDLDLEACKIDILVSDSDYFVNSHLNEFTTKCHLKIVTNPENHQQTESGEMILKTEFAMIKETCSMDCLKNGHCEQGRCVCDSGLTGSSCQLQEGFGPKLNNILGSNACDANIRPCRKIFINASNYEASPNLICSVQEVLANGSVSTLAYLETAEPISDRKLACFLPESGVPSEYSTKTYVVKATYDGVLYGNEIQVMVFDSSCLSCNGTECTQLVNTCHINNLCYQDEDYNPHDSTQICNSALSSQNWSSVPTVPSDYPIMTDPTLVFYYADNVFECTVHTAETSPLARYKVSWYVDDQPTSSELRITTGEMRAVFLRSELPQTGMLTCKIRSSYTNINIMSPYFTSNAIDLSFQRL